MKNILAFVFILGIGMAVSKPVSAQGPGSLDPQYANGGELSDPAIFPYRFSSLALAPADESVVSSAMGDSIQAIRFTYNGNRDIMFGSGNSGITRISAPGFSGTVCASAVQTDRKILIGGQFALNGSNKKAYLLRLQVDGSVDSTFGSNGWVFFNFLPHYGESIHQVALQNDGKIVVTDMGNNPGTTDTLLIARVNTNGTFDTSFATGGVYQIPFNHFLSTSSNVFSLDDANNLTFAGYSNYLSGDYFYLFQLNKNGTLNSAFGNGGNILIDSTNIINGGANLGICFQHDGKLLTVQSRQTGNILWAVCRYNADGSIDQNFGNNGMVNVLPNLNPVPFAVQNIAVTGTGQIIVAGIVTEAGSNRIMVVSLNPDGTTNLSFGNNQGSELLNCFELDDILYNLLIEPSDEILINGLVNEQNYQGYQLVKLLAPSATTAVKAISSNAGLSVYPNPAASQVKCILPGTGKISLTDLAGKTIWPGQINVNEQTIDISNLAPGIYLVTFSNGATVITQRIVKQ